MATGPFVSDALFGGRSGKFRCCLREWTRLQGGGTVGTSSYGSKHFVPCRHLRMGHAPKFISFVLYSGPQETSEIAV